LNDPAVFMPAGGIHRETPMRLLQLSLVAAALAASVTASHAQSAYDYQWCGIYTGNDGPGAMSCYYTTYAQCMATMNGLGYCMQSPYYRGPTPNSDRAHRRARRDY
jgi:hypothetical protein